MTQVPHGPAPTPLAWPPSPLPLLHRLGEAADAPADAGARVRPSDKGSSPFSRSQSPSGAAPDLAARIPRRVPRASPRALRRTAIAARPILPERDEKSDCTHFGGGVVPLLKIKRTQEGHTKRFLKNTNYCYRLLLPGCRETGTRPARAHCSFGAPRPHLYSISMLFSGARPTQARKMFSSIALCLERALTIGVPLGTSGALVK